MAWRRELGRRKTWWVPAGMESHEQAGVEEQADEQLRRCRDLGRQRTRSCPREWRTSSRGVGSSVEEHTGGDVAISRSGSRRRPELGALEELG